MKKNVLITGGSSGLGKETVIAFSNNGYRVLASVRKIEDGQELVKINPNIIPVVMDISNQEQVDSAIDKINQVCGEDGLALLINMAGYTFYSPMEYARPEEVRALFDVLTFGPYRLANALLPALKLHASQGQKSKILNIISWAALDTSPFVGFYSAAKAALLRLSQTQYLELARYNIDAVAILPGLMKTPFIGKVESQIQKTIERLSDQGKIDYEKQLKRMASMSHAAEKSSIAANPTKVAHKILAIAEKTVSKDQYKIGFDTSLVDFMTQFFPFWLLHKIKVATFALNK